MLLSGRDGVAYLLKNSSTSPSIRTSKGRLRSFFPFLERIELSIEHLLATPKPRSVGTLSRTSKLSNKEKSG